MLPGLRILFAITLLSVSVLIFGLGAAAFLRSAHENVASAPWRPIETPATARVDLAPATLAMLRVEPEAVAALPAERIDLPADISAPHESKIPADTPIATPAAADATPPRADPVDATAKSATAEPGPVSTPPMQTDAPQGAQESPIAKTPPEAPAREASVAPAVAEAKDRGDQKSRNAPPRSSPLSIRILKRPRPRPRSQPIRCRSRRLRHPRPKLRQTLPRPPQLRRLATIRSRPMTRRSTPRPPQRSRHWPNRS